MAEQVHAAVHAVQPFVPNPARDGAALKPRPQELRRRDQPLLPGGKVTRTRMKRGRVTFPLIVRGNVTRTVSARDRVTFPPLSGHGPTLPAPQPAARRSHRRVTKGAKKSA